METKMIKITRDGNLLFWVEMLHPRYGWIRVADTPLPEKEALLLSEKIQDWKPAPKKRGKKYDYVRKSRLYLDEIDVLDQEIAIANPGPEKDRKVHRRKVLIEYTLTILGEQI
jgi:hypothetical protein